MPNRITINGPDLLTRAEVADILRIAPETVTRWERAGKLGCIWTPGGTRRYRKADIEAILNGEPVQVAA